MLVAGQVVVSEEVAGVVLATREPMQVQAPCMTSQMWRLVNCCGQRSGEGREGVCTIF